MITTFVDVPIVPFIEAGKNPEMAIVKELRSRWFVIDKPLLPPAEPHVFEVNHGVLVRVPLVPYRTIDDLNRIFPFAVELGVRAAVLCPVGVDHMHLAIGTPVMHTTDEHGNKFCRMYLGIAFRQKE